MMRRLALLALLLPAAASAQGIDLSRGGATDITAQDGIEWRQQEQVVVARGGARAVRDNVTVQAQRLLARYRGSAGASPITQPADAPLSGGQQIWRLEAEGGVRIATATDTATGDRAVYDMDQAVLVLTGRNLSLTTPQQRLTADTSLEYWSQRHMAVARGNAVVTTQDGRRITADTLVAYMRPDSAPARGATPAAAHPGTPGSPPPGQGRLDRVELFGNVEIRTPTEVVRGGRGVYSAETGIARLLDDVRITRGPNQLNGREAIVNLNTGVSRLVSGPNERVRGLITPQGREGLPR
jgi:lipopolysaccharide export system protein LptA